MGWNGQRPDRLKLEYLVTTLGHHLGDCRVFSWMWGLAGEYGMAGVWLEGYILTMVPAPL